MGSLERTFGLKTVLVCQEKDEKRDQVLSCFRWPTEDSFIY